MHKHAKIIMEWAQMMQLPESEWRTLQSDVKHGEGFIDFDCKMHAPSWDYSYEYRWKPRTIRIGDYDVPEPMRIKPENGEIVYLPHLYANDQCSDITWKGSRINEEDFSDGLLHKEKESAIIHTKALRSLTQKKE